MFRRITALVCALALAGALSWTAQAAPVTGSFGLDLVFFPASGGAFKIDYVAVKFEADLVLSMSISGLDLTSTTLFTFHGVEVQLFSAKATVGAMTFTTVLAFAPNILEFEDARSSSSASRGWCLRDSAPSPPPAAASCANGFNARPYPGGPRFFDIFLSDPVVQNIYTGSVDRRVNTRWVLSLAAHPGADLPQEGRGGDALDRGADAGPARALWQLRPLLSAGLPRRVGAHPRWPDGLGDHGAQRDLGRGAPRV
jgi:hypothetical protein